MSREPYSPAGAHDLDPLWSAIRAAHLRWSSVTPAEFPPAPGWESKLAPVGAKDEQRDQSLAPQTPTIPTVPTFDEDEWQARGERGLEDWEERAAILEFEGGLSRIEAEMAAAEEVFGD